MKLRDDDRGASVQIGAILIFGFLVLAIAGWQATVVPQDNAQVEYTHSQRVTDDMQDVRNVVVSAPGETSLRSVSVDMAPEYPPRTIFVNPGPPSGTLRTVGTANASLNLTVDNARATDGNTADFWNGSPRTYNTGGLAYSRGYNVYTGAPDTVYENSVLYDAGNGGGTVTVAGQDIVEGRTVSLVTLNGSLARTSADAHTVDLQALSSSTRTVAVNNSSGGNVTVSFASRRDATWWRETLADAGELDEGGGYVVDVRSTSLGEFHNVTVELAGNTTYRLQMAKVGVGSRTETPGKAYVVDVEGNQSTVPEGSTQKFVVEVRDEYNNPVSGVQVEANASLGSLQETPQRTGIDGRVTFIYEAPNVDGEHEDVDINVTIATGVDPSGDGFDGGTAENLTMDVTVQNSDGSIGPPTIDTFEVTDNSKLQGNNDYAEFDINWAASDPDNELDSVTVYVNNTNDGVTQATYGGASGSETFTSTGDYGDSYEFRIVATDADGNRACYVITDDADGTGSFSKSNGDGSSC